MQELIEKIYRLKSKGRPDAAFLRDNGFVYLGNNYFDWRKSKIIILEIFVTEEQCYLKLRQGIQNITINNPTKGQIRCLLLLLDKKEWNK